MREPLIFGAVLVHFVLGLLAGLPSRSKIRDIPVLGRLCALYHGLNWTQRWSMFAPPAQANQDLQYSVLLPSGWTPLISVEKIILERSYGRLILPRGAFRVLVHLRQNNQDLPTRKVGVSSVRAHYYEKLCDFYCRGAGKIPDAVKIRLYFVSKGIPPFFEMDENGDPSPPASDWDSQVPLYEQTCQG